MTIRTTPAKLHWNYFLALERDMDLTSRYVEFCQSNFLAFSIEFAHLLFAAASEVDVVAKLLCELVEPAAPRGNIDAYRSVLLPALPNLPDTEVIVLRYGLTFQPWENWANGENPDWWRYYSRKLAAQPNEVLAPKDTTQQLYPQSELIRLHGDYYHRYLVAS